MELDEKNLEGCAMCVCEDVPCVWRWAMCREFGYVPGVGVNMTVCDMTMCKYVRVRVYVCVCVSCFCVFVFLWFCVFVLSGGCACAYVSVYVVSVCICGPSPQCHLYDSYWVPWVGCRWAHTHPPMSTPTPQNPFACLCACLGPLPIILAAAFLKFYECEHPKKKKKNDFFQFSQV